MLQLTDVKFADDAFLYGNRVWEPMSPQQTIAHYRIRSKLGEGGMGEVWRATDTKLNRYVAIKVIPEAFAADPDRMARFTREAQVLASLNHPDIAAIYGVEEHAPANLKITGPAFLQSSDSKGSAWFLPIGKWMAYQSGKSPLHLTIVPNLFDELRRRVK